jgi:hypothetical protein
LSEYGSYDHYPFRTEWIMTDDVCYIFCAYGDSVRR